MSNRILFILLILMVLLYFPFLGNVHLFDWDEINFAEAAREMLVTHDFFHVQINFQPFWEKPPLFFWMQALSMKVFGVGEFAARFPNAVCAVFTLWSLVFMGTRLHSRRFGLLWALAFLGSILPSFYFRSGLIDPWFNLFIFWSLWFLFYNRGLFAGLMAGLATLTKGPVAILLLALSSSAILVWRKRTQTRREVGTFFLFLGIAILLGSLWYNSSFLKNSSDYQLRLLNTADSGHRGPFYYHFLVLLLGCFPSSVFAMGALFTKASEHDSYQLFRNWILALGAIVLLVFSLVQTKIIHYSSLAYFPLTFLSAEFLTKLEKGGVRFSFSAISFALVGTVISLALIAFPILAKTKAIPIHDEFAKACLYAPVDWHWGDMAIGLLFFLSLLAAMIVVCISRKALFFELSFVASFLMVLGIQLSFIPRIEEHIQGAAIRFYENHRNDGSDVQVVRFKSYAHLFYTRKVPSGNANQVYAVSKIQDSALVQVEKPSLKPILTQNGFVFFKDVAKR